MATGTDLDLPKGDELPPGFVAAFLADTQQRDSAGKQPTPEEQMRAGITRLLGTLGSLTVQEDSLIFSGQKFILPEQYAGKVRSAIDFLENWLHQQEKPHKITRTMAYRPYDGANAFAEVMKTLTGTTGFGVTKMTMFGPKHPEFKTINIAHDKTTQVPWGDVKFPSFDAEFNVGATMDPERGIVFHLTCLAPKKWRQHIEAIFTMIEDYLQEKSIYRGKSINGAEEEPEFFDLSKVDPNSVFYSSDVLKQLRANIWVPIRHPDKLRQRGMPIKRAVLLAGEYGCLAADTEIAINRGGKGFTVSIENLVNRFNGVDARYSWDPTIPTMVQREMPDGTIRLGRIVNAWTSGMKQTFTVTTSTGRTVRGTDIHPFLTERGWVKLGELIPGDVVHVRGEQKGEGSQRERDERKQYKSRTVGDFHPYRKGDENSSFHVFEHRLVVEAAENGLSLDNYLVALRSGNIAGLKFLEPEVWHVHHKDGDTLNNDLANLEKLRHRDHHLEHAAEFTKNVLFKIANETIVSIEPFDTEMTYDLEVEGEPHNFLANGFVVHNTGKTLAGFLTALEADRHGYTFIQCRPGKDDPATVLKTAALYSPAVVFIEDIDTHTKGDSDMDISRMLEMLDGMGNKGSEIITIFTTNHLKMIQKGALRPGRIDAVIEIGDLDEAGFRNCVTYTVGADQLATDVDWHAVAQAFDGFRPAFVVEAARRATRYALGESEDGEIDILNTEDLILAAGSLRPQLELMKEAKEGARRTTFEDIIRGQVEGVIKRMTNEQIGAFEIEPATTLNGARH